MKQTIALFTLALVLLTTACGKNNDQAVIAEPTPEPVVESTKYACAYEAEEVLRQCFFGRPCRIVAVEVFACVSNKGALCSASIKKGTTTIQKTDCEFEPITQFFSENAQ